jgi:DNA repair protein RadC
MYVRKQVGSFEALVAYVRQALVPLKTEAFFVVYLDTQYGVLQDKVHQMGTLNHVAVYPREIIKEALGCGAAYVVLAHNHPGGDPKPSFEDLKLTHEIKTLAQTLDISLLDHLIVGHLEVVSLKALGHL